MSSLPSPEVPQYRVTLFFGPETEESNPDLLYCVFNVKKRSWKGGIQVVVKLEVDQFRRLKKKLGFTEWLETAVAEVPPPEREDFIQRGHDILAQCLCQTKLFLAIKEKFQQENCELEERYLMNELEDAVDREKDGLKTQVLHELDIPQQD